jgi:hypothetical protein
MMHVTAIALLVLILEPMRSVGQEWRYFVGEHSIHKVLALGEGQIPDGRARTTFTLVCRRQNGKAELFLFYGVRDAGKIKSFDFEYFHGPGAKALGRKLVRLSVQTGSKKIAFRMSASGAYSDMDNPQDFQFSIGKAPPRLIKWLLKGPKTLTVRVKDDRRKGSEVFTEFPAENAGNAVSQLLKDCGR